MKAYVACYGVNDFAFYDLTAIVRRDWIVAFCELLIAEGLAITWQLPSGTRTEALDEEVCRLMYRAGCRNLNYAPESGSERILTRIKKRVKLPRTLESMRGAVRAGLEVKTNIILGFPGETLADVLQTYRFIARVAAAGVEAVSIFPFSPYPGTELYDELAAAHRVRLDAAYFQSLVYTDLARMVSYNELFTTAQLRALVLVGNALFLAVQAATHPRRVLDRASLAPTDNVATRHPARRPGRRTCRRPKARAADTHRPRAPAPRVSTFRRSARSGRMAPGCAPTGASSMAQSSRIAATPCAPASSRRRQAGRPTRSRGDVPCTSVRTRRTPHRPCRAAAVARSTSRVRPEAPVVRGPRSDRALLGKAPGARRGSRPRRGRARCRRSEARP